MSKYLPVDLTYDFVTNSIERFEAIIEAGKEKPHPALTNLLFEAMYDRIRALTVEFEAYVMSAQISAETVLNIAEKAAKKRLKAESIKVSDKGSVTYSSAQFDKERLLQERHAYADVVRLAKARAEEAEQARNEEQQLAKSSKDNNSEKRELTFHNKYMIYMADEIKKRVPDLSPKAASKLASLVWREYSILLKKRDFGKMSKEEQEKCLDGGNDILQRYMENAQNIMNHFSIPSRDNAFRIVLNMEIEHSSSQPSS